MQLTGLKTLKYENACYIMHTMHFMAKKFKIRDILFLQN